jgi:long-subunit fatty acid transport protein
LGEKVGRKVWKGGTIMQFKITEKFGYIIIITMVLCNASGVWAQKDAAQEPLLLYRGVRPMGMGNAFEAIADDINALHYNPAGIAQTDEKLFEFLAVRPRITTGLFGELST